MLTPLVIIANLVKGSILGSKNVALLRLCDYGAPETGEWCFKDTRNSPGGALETVLVIKLKLDA